MVGVWSPARWSGISGAMGRLGKIFLMFVLLSVSLRSGVASLVVGVVSGCVGLRSLREAA
jgi:hypothetical protein